MFTFLFPQLLWIGQIPEHTALKTLFNKGIESLDYYDGDWGCTVRTSFHKEQPGDIWERYAQAVFQPLSEMLATLNMEVPARATLSDNWRNLYNKGDFQEVHSHDPADFSIVYFVNYDPQRDAKLCFYNQHRNDVQFLNRYQSAMVNEYHPSCYVLDDVQEGDVVIFPSTTPHFTQVQRHDTNRLTVASNVMLSPIENQKV